MTNTNLLGDPVSHLLESMLLMLTWYAGRSSRRFVHCEGLCFRQKGQGSFFFWYYEEIEDAIIDGWAIGLIEDYGALAVTIFFLGLHLHVINARIKVSHCQSIYLWMSMILFTSLTGVNIMPKMNMVSETLSNIFILMCSDEHAPCYCTSELAEHGFGNTWRSQSEFTCLDFPSYVEKENCCMKTMFEWGLSPSCEQLKWYQETFLNFIQHGMKVQRSNKQLVDLSQLESILR